MANVEQKTDEPSGRPKHEKAAPRSRWRRNVFLVSLVLLAIPLAGWFYFIRMPGNSFTGDVGSPGDEATRVVGEDGENAGDDVVTKPLLKDELREYVEHLSETIGERNLGRYEQLNTAADYVESSLKSWDWETDRQSFQCRGLDCFNIVAEVKGATEPDQIVIIGAHYDSAVGTPGANDNGSGTAAMLALARHFRSAKPAKTLRFIGWTNEEPPYFQVRSEMGSWVYAESCRRNNEDIVGVISLETMGYFSDEEDSQNYPAPLDRFYPSTGNFIGFVSNTGSRPLQHRVIKVFREHAKLPSEGASLPASIPGVGWSDHWSFWQEGYQGIMVTDTAPFRYPHYHEPTDHSKHIDYQRFSAAVEGLKFVIKDLAEITDE